MERSAARAWASRAARGCRVPGRVMIDLSAARRAVACVPLPVRSANTALLYLDDTILRAQL